jgi:AcrR family transcriptional regulator
MDQIAAAAGVAVGTLYRHFPTKTDLPTAVIAEYVDDVAGYVEAARGRVIAGARPIDELVAFLVYVVEASATDRAVKAAAQALGARPTNQVDDERVAAALGYIVEAALTGSFPSLSPARGSPWPATAAPTPVRRRLTAEARRARTSSGVGGAPRRPACRSRSSPVPAARRPRPARR